MFKASNLIIPTRAGQDLDSVNGKLDGHIRIETYRELGTRIYVDLFDSSVRDANSAHIDSLLFPWTDEGADEATRFLQSRGFRVAIALK